MEEKFVIETVLGRELKVREFIVDLLIKIDEGSLEHFRFWEIICDRDDITTDESCYINYILNECED